MIQKKITQAILIVLLSWTILAGCGSSEHAEPAAADGADATVFTEVILPERGHLEGLVRIPGELQAFQQVDLYAKVSSFVKQLHADVGTEVKAGQLLATLEAPELGAQQNAASSRLKSQEALFIASKARYERLLKTSETPGTISPNDLEQAFARQQADLAQLEAARAAYREVIDTRNYLQIRAPFNGIIAARNVSAGAYVGPSGKGSEQPIFTLVEQKKLRLVVNVPDMYAGILNKKGEARFTVSGAVSDTFQARIARTAGALDRRLRSERVEMDVANNNGRLLPGMLAEIILPLQSDSSTLHVPASSVLNSTQGVFVIRMKEGKAEWVPVKTGTKNNARTEITGAIHASDTLVLHATEEIREGQEIPVKR